MVVAIAAGRGAPGAVVSKAQGPAHCSRHERRLSFVDREYPMQKYLYLLTASLAVAAPAFAQAGEEIILYHERRVPETAITVLATGTQTRVDQSGQAIAVLDAADIARIQGQDLTRSLERIPGLTLSRNGGVGTATSVRLRGSEGQHVLVLVDGVRLEDTSAPSGGTDFGTLTPGGIGKIEVLRGSNSVVWGSSAIGGVIALTSRELNGVEATGEYGAYDTATGDLVAGLSGDRGALTLNGGYTRTDGISAAAAGTEPDGFRQWRAGGRGRVTLTDALSLTATARYADSRVETDSFLQTDSLESQKTRQLSGRVGAHYEGDGVQLDAGYALSDTRRRYYDDAFGPDLQFQYQGRSERADLTGRIDLPACLALDFGADSEWTRFDSTFDDRQKARLTSGHALIGYYTDRLTLAAGARIDDHSRFGTEWTFGANGNLRLVGDLRLRASYGEGFRTPTLSQLYGFGGNLGLEPEKSHSYDVGLQKGDAYSTFRGAVTAFRRDTRNLIDYVFPAGYENVSKARSEGVEVELGARIASTLTAQAVYTYVKSENRTAGSPQFGFDLARRPRNAVTVSADWTPAVEGLFAGLSLGADVRMVSDSFDNRGNTVRIDGYEVVTLRAAVPVGERFEIYGRIENLFDETYQVATGYGTPGRSAYAGVRARF